MTQQKRVMEISLVVVAVVFVDVAQLAINVHIPVF